MRVLVDTHVIIWAVDEPSRLTPAAEAVLLDPTHQLLGSEGSIWEIAIKVGLGKLQLNAPFRSWTESAVRDLDLELMPVTIEYADAQPRLPLHHNDPFDRLLIAQALVECVPIISADSKFDAYGVTRIWA